jgi:hypothetical protein
LSCQSGTSAPLPLLKRPIAAAEASGAPTARSDVQLTAPL